MATAAGELAPAGAPGAAVIMGSAFNGDSNTTVEHRSAQTKTSTDNSETCDGAESDTEIAAARNRTTISAAAVPPLRLSDLEPRDLNVLFK